MSYRPDSQFVTVEQHIMSQLDNNASSNSEFIWLISAITLSTKIISSYVARAGMIDIWGATDDENVQGETVQKLDRIANDTLEKTLGQRGSVGIIASEEDDEPKVVQEVPTNGQYIVMFDPLDGSSNIDSNVSIGTIWTIFRNIPHIDGVADSVLQPGVQQVAAGYVLYGSSTVMVYAVGTGVHMFTLDPQFGAFLLTKENITMPEFAPQYSVNEAYLNTFPKPYQDYLDWAKDSSQMHGGFSSRYIGSLVADFHRILIKGGLFMYPPTQSHPDGKLRLMYECNPLAFIAEQAGGMASDGSERILKKMPEDVHSRTGLVIGGKQNVEQVHQFTCADVRV